MGEEEVGGKRIVLNAALSGVMAALVFITTMMIRVPVPATQGYINIGDCMIFVSALLFGPLVGGFAGGVGSALADLVGYPSYTLYTLVIKGIEGLIVGSLTTGKNSWKDIPVVILGGIEMIAGYFIVESYLYGVGPALAELPGNIFQASFGAIVAIPLCFAVRRRLAETISAIRISLRG
ncbi:MAG: ECF transporter S component [Candidatus Bathyarchaeia archaeon]